MTTSIKNIVAAFERVTAERDALKKENEELRSVIESALVSIKVMSMPIVNPGSVATNSQILAILEQSLKQALEPKGKL